MARITAYPAIPAIAGGDLLVVSDVGTAGNPTKTVTVDALSAYVGSTEALGYKTYAVELSNFGGGAVAPTATVMQNTLGTIVATVIAFLALKLFLIAILLFVKQKLLPSSPV